MQRVNEDYAKRVTNALKNAISSLNTCAENEVVCDNDREMAISIPNFVTDLEALREQMSAILTLTLLQDESLRSDTRKFECERSTKNDKLSRLRAYHSEISEEREERRLELENELSDLKAIFKEKRQVLAEEQDLKEQIELSELEQQRERYENERKILKEKKKAVFKSYEDQGCHFANTKSSIEDNILSLKMDIQKLSSEREVFARAKQTDVESVKTQLEQEKKQRLVLEEHFKRVEADNAIKREENERLRMVFELERQAQKLLDHGAISLQKLWRGVKERELVAKMKSKKKKKGGGGKKKKKK